MDPKLFSIFEGTNWSAREEYALLNAIDENGYGNWDEIGRRMCTRTPEECSEHYNKFYVNECPDFIPKHPPTKVILPNIVTPYNFRVKNIEDPPRCLARTQSSNVLAGYMPARSDFEQPFDSHAEQIMSSVSRSMIVLDRSKRQGLMENLAVAVFKAYNNRLRERTRRYKVMQTHGLIQGRRPYFLGLAQLENLFPGQNFDKFLGFAQFMPAVDFDYIMHSLFRQRELKNKLAKLQMYRTKGIRTFYGIQVYHKLKNRREAMHGELQSFIHKTDLAITKCEVTDCIPGASKRVVAPLDIVGLPGFSKLSEAEKQICSTVRLVPDSYLELRRALVAECEKMFGLRLQDARKAIRIDVNKTRKLYDFLIEQGFIYKPNI